MMTQSEYDNLLIAVSSLKQIAGGYARLNKLVVERGMRIVVNNTSYNFPDLFDSLVNDTITNLAGTWQENASDLAELGQITQTEDFSNVEKIILLRTEGDTQCRIDQNSYSFTDEMMIVRFSQGIALIVENYLGTINIEE